jgi:hypothetical protein
MHASRQVGWEGGGGREGRWQEHRSWSGLCTLRRHLPAKPHTDRTAADKSSQSSHKSTRVGQQHNPLWPPFIHQDYFKALQITLLLYRQQQSVCAEGRRGCKVAQKVPGAHRMSHAHRAHIGVWFISILVGAAAEGLGAGQQLHVCLNTNHGFILQHMT